MTHPHSSAVTNRVNVKTSKSQNRGAKHHRIMSLNYESLAGDKLMNPLTTKVLALQDLNIK